MSTGLLTIRLDAIAENWRALAGKSAAETGAVVKADAYGLGAKQVARELARAGARSFFIAVAEEAAPLRAVLGDDVKIYVFSGHMAGDTEIIRDLNLVPLLNSIDQLTTHVKALPGHPFGIQLDTGMNRLGMEWEEWAAVAEIALNAGADGFLMSHLACADEPDHPMNPYQLDLFRQMTDGTNVPRSLAATGGILLGPDYHFDLTRPGIGLYGGLPFAEAAAAARLDLPVVQCRTVGEGEVVGYGNTWQAPRDTRLATINCGYADGMLRSASDALTLYYEGLPCPAVGRISMDLITVDVTDLGRDPEYLSLLCPENPVDVVAEAAGTIGYEVLTSLGQRYQRRYTRS